jgi:small basic protein (TIGR04137 family)
VTIDKTLRRTGRLKRSRNVLTRAERISHLQFEDRWAEGQSALGLPKVRVAKLAVGKKKKKAKAADEGDEENADT